MWPTTKPAEKAPQMEGPERLLRSMGLGQILDMAKALAEAGTLQKIVQFADDLEQVKKTLAEIKSELGSRKENVGLSTVQCECPQCGQRFTRTIQTDVGGSTDNRVPINPERGGLYGAVPEPGSNAPVGGPVRVDTFEFIVSENGPDPRTG